MTTLDKSLSDLRREVNDLRQIDRSHDNDTKRLSSIISTSRDSLKETEQFQQHILSQLQQFELSLADINEILRANIERKLHLQQQQQQQSGDDLDIRAKLMALNAETLECRAAAIQLQQEARMVLSKAAELEKLASEELAQQAMETKSKQQEWERDRAAELERRVKLEEERQRLKKDHVSQGLLQSETRLMRRSIVNVLFSEDLQQQQERILAMAKNPVHESEYASWSLHDFMQNDQSPSCVVRTSPNDSSMPLDVTYLAVAETEYLLDNQEELISTPLTVKFNPTQSHQQVIALAIPYLVKRSPHRENIIKIRQADGLWVPIDSHESTLDSHKEKHFVECTLTRPSACAVVSRLKRERVLIERHTPGRYSSSADPRFTFQWSRHVCETDFHIQTCIQPVDLTTFTQFCEQFKHECLGLLAVGPIIQLSFDDISLLKPIQFTVPILVQPKKKSAPPKPTQTATDAGNNLQESQQDLITQQQQEIFKTMLGEDLSNERLVLLYSSVNENIWHIDKDIRLANSKVYDIITTDIQALHSRMIVARYDKHLMSAQQLQTAICLFEQKLSQRSASLILLHRLSNPREICLVCCSSQRVGMISNEIQEENYANLDEQTKEIVLQEGQLLDLRFRGNVLPVKSSPQPVPFAFNTNFPFYFETNISEIDKYSQHLSAYFYGYIQIYSKQKSARNLTREMERKKQPIELAKQDCQEEVCLTEILVSLPKPFEGTREPIGKTLSAFTGEDLLTAELFRDMSASLVGNEWRWLGTRLGMTRMRLDAIERDYHDEAPYYMLLTWFKRVPRSSDKVLALTHGLMNINRRDLAQELQVIQKAKRSEQRPSTKEEQLRRFRMPFARICQRDECVRIWKQLARELALSNQEIEHIEQSYPSKHERCLRCLEQWAATRTDADLSSLATIVRTLGFKSLAREIESMA